MDINLLDKIEGQLISALGGDVYSEGNGVFRAIFEESEWAMTAHTYAPKIAAFNQIPGIKVVVQIIKDEPRSDKHLINLYKEIRMK